MPRNIASHRGGSIIWTYDFLVDDVDPSHAAVCFLAVREAANLLRVHGEALVARSDHVADFKAVNRGVGLDNDVNILMLSCE